MQFHPAPGVPKETAELIREYMKVAETGGSVPKSLQQRAREDPYLLEKGIKLGFPRSSSALQPWPKPGDDAKKVDPSLMTVRGPDGEVIEDWETMSPAERRKMLRSKPEKPIHPKRTAARRLKAEVWREFRQLRPTLTPDAYRKALDVMRVVVDKYSDEGPQTVSDEDFQRVKQQVKSEFAEEMKRRHDDWGPNWGRRRRGTL